ncbi:malate synthase A [Citricoccus nitrophenolicus]|uniref:Malate synthase n=1 Tax=Citricoccus nitrophenolicus TaxID=863575 RepID=A0ABV0IGR9_9MICC|nr:malate synthase A [Citricoccus sp. I39-566]WMY79226.1 malate synthase A [Citricoccus sp. I39-566]
MYPTDQPITLNSVTITGPHQPRQEEILTTDALDFLATLHRRFNGRRAELLTRREEMRQRISEGWTPDFLPETRTIREDDSWRVAPLAPGLKDRRVEITGPVDRKMTINAMNSGAKCWLADFEDSSSPSWSNMLGGQVNLRDAIRRQIDFTSPEGKEYKLGGVQLVDRPTIIVRPRGWHLDEDHLLVDGEPMAGALVDFGLYFFHNAKELLRRGVGPYFYLPKTENHLEARLWNCVFVVAQDLLGIPQGTVRATVLIETITAAFEMEEILYQLRNHAAGLNAGRWDYIFSIIKNFRDRGEDFVLPDRADVTMTAPMMRSYTDQLVRACHRRGASAIGGMAAFIPNRRDPEANEKALDKVREDKTREASDGFDGSWVAHPDLVPVAMEVFDAVLGETRNQIRSNRREDVQPDAEGLLAVSGTPGSITEAGVRMNLEVGIRYVESWLRGNGAAAIHNLMEDAATAEISRSQIWQWINAGSTARLAEGGERTVTREWVQELMDEEFGRIDRAEGDRFDDALEVFAGSALAEEYPDFLTLPAYRRFLSATAPARQELAGTPA